MAYGRDPDAYTRGVGAIAQRDLSPKRRQLLRLKAAKLARRDAAMASLTQNPMTRTVALSGTLSSSAQQARHRPLGPGSGPCGGGGCRGLPPAVAVPTEITVNVNPGQAAVDPVMSGPGGSAVDTGLPGGTIDVIGSPPVLVTPPSSTIAGVPTKYVMIGGGALLALLLLGKG